MNKFIKTLTLKNISKSAEELTAKCSPILLTSLQLSLMLTLMMMTLPSFAEQVEGTSHTASKVNAAKTGTIHSFSIGQLTNQPNKLSNDQIQKELGQRVLLGGSDQTKNITLNMTRNELITEKHLPTGKKNSPSLHRAMLKNIASTPNTNNTRRSFSDGNFVIYQAYSQLIQDYDADGYYQTFSVTFDADLITHNPHDEAVVYAELYLSENGGPWQHYYTTDNFIIHGESSEDEFEIYSTLSQGFNANHYNVLIDLYESGYSNIVASYSSDDTNRLYALPLESSDSDMIYIEYNDDEHSHGGATSLMALLMFFTIFFMRRFY